MACNICHTQEGRTVEPMGISEVLIILLTIAAVIAIPALLIAIAVVLYKIYKQGQ